MSRNANGEGSIYPWRRNGKPAGYKGAISFKDANGETKRFVAYGRTRKLVKDKLDKARGRLNDGAPVKDSKQSVGEWLVYWRSTGLAASKRKESTKVLYGNLSRKHLEPAPFGNIRLDRLKATDVDALLLGMRQRTKPGKGEGAEPVRALADSTIFNVYCVLRAGLDGAVRDGLIARNVATLVDRPQVAKLSTSTQRTLRSSFRPPSACATATSWSSSPERACGAARRSRSPGRESIWKRAPCVSRRLSVVLDVICLSRSRRRSGRSGPFRSPLPWSPC
jgi:hypothetical protein